MYQDWYLKVSDSYLEVERGRGDSPLGPGLSVGSRIAGFVPHGIITYLRILCGCVSERIAAFLSLVRKWSESERI